MQFTKFPSSTDRYVTDIQIFSQIACQMRNYAKCRNLVNIFKNRAQGHLKVICCLLCLIVCIYKHAIGHSKSFISR